MRLIDGLHITATDKRHIANIIAAKSPGGTTSRAVYSVRHITGQRYSVQIVKNERDDIGRPVSRRSLVIIEL